MKIRGAFKNWSNVEIQPLDTYQVSFEITRLQVIGFVIIKNVGKKPFVFGNSNILNLMRSAPSGQNSTFNTPLNAKGSVLSSVL